ncbi:MAG: hypothetical protein ACRELF_22340, partial [Gemmataceae bacterium]
MMIYPDPDFTRLPENVVGLFEGASAANFFSHIGWYELMSRSARAADTQVRLYVDAEPPSAGLLLRTDGKRRLHGFSNAYTMEYGPIGRSNAASCMVLHHLAEAIAKEDPRRRTIRIAALDPLAASYAALRDGLRAAYWVVKPFFDCGNWYEDTAGLDFRSYLDARPAVLRNTFRRKTKTAAKEGAEYVFSHAGCDISRLIEDYETVYRNSWKTAEPFAQFMHDLIRLSFRLGALR